MAILTGLILLHIFLQMGWFGVEVLQKKYHTNDAPEKLTDEKIKTIISWKNAFSPVNLGVAVWVYLLSIIGLILLGVAALACFNFLNSFFPEIKDIYILAELFVNILVSRYCVLYYLLYKKNIRSFPLREFVLKNTFSFLKIIQEHFLYTFL